ncbi:MAG: single-stranded-DNA-specific exonuclease RecJ [Thermodesulfobacteriota bacterium]
MTRIWRLKPLSRQARTLAERTGLGLPEAQVLVNRGICDEKRMASFLSPRLSSLLDPFLMKDMEDAVSLLLEAVKDREPIIVYGDYDADGLTATALLVHFLTYLGIPLSHYIPNRLTEGYGLHASAVRRSSPVKGGLLVTVDCGVSGTAEIRVLQDLGMKVIVTDHHQIPEAFEAICPTVNPHRPDCPFPFKGLSGAGVAFFLLVALRSRLREAGWFESLPEPDLRDYLDLVALGTVADMVPLADQNRILVSSGLERIRDSRWPGLLAIQEACEFGPSPRTSDDLAFRVAPRLNASGRMGEAEAGIALLTADNLPLARRLAGRLNRLNVERQEAETAVLNEIEATLPSRVDPNSRRTLVFAGEGWHRGVLGIVASRLVEKYHRPTIVLDVRDGVAAGSGRSIPGFDLYHALTKLGPLLSRFGGHRQAAGLGLEVSRIEAFAEGLEAVALEQIRPEDLVAAIEVDAEAALQELDVPAAARLSSYGPFGSGNPEPVFYSGDLEVLEARTVGDRHLRIRVRQGAAVADGIGFGLADRYDPRSRRVNLVYRPGIHEWQGLRRVELKVMDMEESGHSSRLQRLEAE